MDNDLQATYDKVVRENPYAWAISMIACMLACGNIRLGMVLMLAPERVQGPSFTYVLEAGSPAAWGRGFILAGIIAVFGQFAGRKWPARLGHGWSAAMCLWWVGCFALGGYHVPTSSLTGCVAYGIICAAHVAIAAVPPVKP